MNWYKIRVRDVTQRFFFYVGSSPDSFESLSQKASRGEYVRLDDLLYMERGEIKDWAQWDKREVASVSINPAHIIAIQPFRDDPRTLPK